MAVAVTVYVTCAWDRLHVAAYVELCALVGWLWPCAVADRAVPWWLWRQGCPWDSACHSVCSRCWRGWERPGLPLCCFFQAAVPLSSASRAWGCILAWCPGNAVPPLLALGSFCSTSHLFLLFPDPARCPGLDSRVQSSGQARLLTLSALSLALGWPQAVATPESRLPAAWGLGTDAEHGLILVQEQTSG